MSKIRVLSDQLANQIAAGEVVERPASVAKELVENSIDAGARRISVDVEGGGRRLLRITDDGEGMTRDDAVLAFERHATSKIARAEDLSAIATLGFRGEALASIASVARVELLTKTDGEAAGTRVLIEGGRMRDVKDAAHPRGTTLTVRDLFFNVPARRKFLRSEATETFHLTNLVTHYALAHPEIAFTLTNNGRETLRCAPAKDLRERAYQIFGTEFLENLLEVDGGNEMVARVRGFVSAPRERRTSRDAQYLFINGRFVRDRLIGRALSEGYRSVLPHGVYPVALLFLDVPLEEVDVNVHPAKTEVRFRRAAAVSDAVREAVRSSLASAGYLRDIEFSASLATRSGVEASEDEKNAEKDSSWSSQNAERADFAFDTRLVAEMPARNDLKLNEANSDSTPTPEQHRIEFGIDNATDEISLREETQDERTAVSLNEQPASSSSITENRATNNAAYLRLDVALPPIVSISNQVREVPVESVSTDIRPLGQIEESYILATDAEGLLLIDQHAAHERVLFDKYHRLEGQRAAESQNLLIPETFDLTPAQAAAFDTVVQELEAYGFGLMRLSGRTVAIRAVPADLPAGEARNMLAEILDTVDMEKRGTARATLREEVAASLACHAAIKVNTPLAIEKMRWLIDRLLRTSSPTTCPHGRPSILRLTTRDIEKGFHRI
ncbi:MAG: DNA mismatch repair endonuclease MutL [Pyrinomonadaceae bacterium]